MARLSLRLPETLHHQLRSEARREGVSINHYLVYLLAQRAPTAYSVSVTTPEEIEAQKASFDALLRSLPTGTDDEIRRALAERELPPPEERAPAELVVRFERRAGAR